MFHRPRKADDSENAIITFMEQNLDMFAMVCIINHDLCQCHSNATSHFTRVIVSQKKKEIRRISCTWQQKMDMSGKY